ncbi:MAG: hypothetical protein AAGL69_07205 [Pseudomonadota bacterium]
MTFISGRNEHGFAGFHSLPRRLGLWVVFDDQYDDARILLTQKNHKPARVISREEMASMEAEVEASFAGATNALFDWVMTILACGLLLCLAGYVVYGVLNAT